MVALALPLAACLLSCLTAVRGSIHDFRNNMTPIWRLSPQRELEDEGLTVMINTYKRPDMLQGAVEHYHRCGVVRSVRVVWCEKGQASGGPERRRSLFKRVSEITNYVIHSIEGYF